MNYVVDIFPTLYKGRVVFYSTIIDENHNKDIDERFHDSAKAAHKYVTEKTDALNAAWEELKELETNETI